MNYIKSSIQIGIIILFLSIITLPLLYCIFYNINAILPNTIKNTSLNDSYSQKYEDNFNLNFGFRKELIRCYYFYKIKLFNDPPRIRNKNVSNIASTESFQLHNTSGLINNQLIIGKNEWIYYGPPNDGYGIEDFKGNIILSNDSLFKMKTNLEQQREWLKIKGIPFIVIVCPNKQSIYPEFLPNYFKKGKTVSEQINSYFKTHSTLKLIYLHNTLIASKNKFSFPLYFNIDTHWNSLGAFIGYMKIIKCLQEFLPLAEPVPLANYLISSERIEGGDIPAMLGLEAFYDDTKIIFRKVKNAKKFKKYKSAYVIHDSFYYGLEPYLKENFDTIYTSNCWDGFNYKEIEKLHPNIVIFETVERYQNHFLNNNPKEIIQLK